MTHDTALYEARMAVAAAHRIQATLFERHAAAEQAETALWNDPGATLEQLRTARQEHMKAWAAAAEGERQIERLREQENAAIRGWVEATAEGR